MYIKTISIILILLLTAGCVASNTITAPENQLPIIYGATDSEIYIINNVLNNTDEYIVKSIKTITVINKTEIDCNGVESLGCSNIIYDRYLEADITLISENNYGGIFNTFESTLYHEIGHVVDAKDGFSGSNFKDETYATLYSEARCVNKGNTDEYKKLEKDIDAALSDYEESYYILNVQEDVLKKYDKYGSSIPDYIYDEYLSEYDLYIYYLEDYNQKIDLYNTLIDEQNKLLW